MTNLLLGEENFQKSITSFIKQYHFATATRDNLWSIMTEIALANKIIPEDLTIKAIMDTWLLQAGYPYLSVKIDYQNKKVFVSQVSCQKICKTNISFTVADETIVDILGTIF